MSLDGLTLVAVLTREVDGVTRVVILRRASDGDGARPPSLRGRALVNDDGSGPHAEDFALEETVVLRELTATLFRRRGGR